MAETRRCDVPGCAVNVARGRLMCRTHWYQVPKPLRDGVWHWWRTMSDRTRSGTDERLTAIAEYRKAVEQAVKSVTDRRAAG